MSLVWLHFLKTERGSMSDYQISFVAPCVIVGMLVFIVMALFFGWVIAPVYEHRGEKEIMKQAIEHNAAYY